MKKYIYELTPKQYKLYWKIATKLSRGLITNKDFKNQLNKILS